MKKTSRIFWGLGFITAAVFLVLSQMHLITAQISVWSALIGILCAALLVSSIADRSFGGIFFSLGIISGCITAYFLLKKDRRGLI